MDKNSNGGVKVSVRFMTFFLCKKEHFNNLDQFSNMDFFFLPTNFQGPKQKGRHMLYPTHSDTHRSFNFNLPHASKCYIRPVSWYVRVGARPN